MGLLTMVGEHLTTENLPSFTTIALSWTSKPLENLGAELPAALYYLAANESEASPFNTAVIQAGDYRLGILVVCEITDLEDLREELKAAMVGFQPEGQWDPFEHERGEMLQINQKIIWWLDEFAARNYRD